MSAKLTKANGSFASQSKAFAIDIREGVTSPNTWKKLMVLDIDFCNFVKFPRICA